MSFKEPDGFGIGPKRDTSKVQWLGETECNICHEPCGETLYDAATVFGPWAVMCYRDFLLHGRGLGQGRGQKYERQEDGTYLKVEG